MPVTVSEERPRTVDAGVKQTHDAYGTVMRASPFDRRVGGQGPVQQGSRDDGRTRHEERLYLFYVLGGAHGVRVRRATRV